MKILKNVWSKSFRARNSAGTVASLDSWHYVEWKTLFGLLVSLLQLPPSSVVYHSSSHKRYVLSLYYVETFRHGARLLLHSPNSVGAHILLFLCTFAPETCKVVHDLETYPFLLRLQLSDSSKRHNTGRFSAPVGSNAKEKEETNK